LFDLNEFVERSKRVLNVTHKPRDQEYRKMALSTGLGMVLIGAIGFLIGMVANLFRGY
jgi:protein translocase SEC61 complex gamma subunit